MNTPLTGTPLELDSGAAAPAAAPAERGARWHRLRDRVSLRRRLPLSRRLALIVALAVAIAVALACAAAYVTSRSTLYSQVDRSLRSQGAIVQGVPPGAFLCGTSPRCSSALLTLSPYIQVIFPNGDRESINGQLPVDAADLAVADGQRAEDLRNITVAGRPYRMLTLPYGPGQAVQITAPLSSVDSSLHRLFVVLLAVALVGLVVAISAGLVVSRAGLAPIGELTAAVERIGRTEELGPEIPLRRDRGRPDEVTRLAASFNKMLRALAASRDRQRQLVADASHELRTPLTSLRTNVELLARAEAQDRPLATEDRRRLLADLTAQTAELATLVGELTAVAREEVPAEEPDQLDLADVAAAAAERVRLRASGIRIVTDLEPSPLVGRRGVLERAVLNVLDNAVKWSPPGGEVYLGLRDHTMLVADQGPGVPAEDLPHVFERFYRSRNARGLPGSGLGLSIVADAVAEHQGTVRVERGVRGGTVVRMWVPGMSASPGSAN